MHKMLSRALCLFMLVKTSFAEISVIPQPNTITMFPGKLKASWPLDPSHVRYTTCDKLVDEAYTLRVSPSKIFIESKSPSGRFYAEQTLKQIIMASKGGAIPCLTIKDAPRYKWRGFMLDESRHFFGKRKVLQLIDQMAMYKLNRLHWHLTDSQGWRIEIRKYPKLTSIGSVGNHSTPNAPAAFYTQEEIKEIIKYASDRFIEIIPEIDMPGHAGAVARAYPEISGGGSETHPDFTFNPGSEKTYAFLTDVLSEVAQLFPSQWIHFGGDEVHFANKQWLDLPDVKELMQIKKLNNLTEVEHYFNRRMADIITGLNRTTVGWDEVVQANLDQQTTLVMWWRHDKKDVLADAQKKKNKIVLCPRIPCYFDFVQHESHKTGRRAGGFCSIDKTYAFPKGLNLDNSLIQGIQANLWTETVQTERRLDFMTYPRLMALSEAAWTEEENKNYEQFLGRLKLHLSYLEDAGIYYFNPFEPSKTPEPFR